MNLDDTYITLRECPELRDRAAAWFHEKWGVPTEAYLDCMNAYLNRETEYGWYLCLCGERIVGGLGVIENDFHDRKDLTPNVCAVYTGLPLPGDRRTAAAHGGGGSARQGRLAGLPCHRPHRFLRALRLGISLHGAGGRGTGDDKDVRTQIDRKILS